MTAPAPDALAEAVRDLDPDEFIEVVQEAAPDEQKLLLRARYRWHIDEFCRAMWPERFDLPFNEFHHDQFSRALSIEPWQTRKVPRYFATAAPRGYAKSTIASFAVLVHAIVYDLEAYIVLISAGKRLALSLTRDLRQAFLDESSPLSTLYGPFEVRGGVEEPLISVNGRPSVGILSASFQSEVRGAKHPERGIRPTRVVMDDSEKKDRVRSAEQRAIWWSTLNKDILKLGQRGAGMVADVVGTILNADSMLANLMDRPGWETALYKAIISWPERPDLWDRCRLIWSNLTLGKLRRDAALAFYRSNRREMDKGVEVLDPGVEGIFELYEQIWAGGLAAFLQEKQNEPRLAAAAYFDSQGFARCRVEADHVIAADGRVVPFKAMRIVAYWDPIPGKELRALGDEGGSGAGDYAAIAVIGRDQYGYSFVLDVWMKRAKDSIQRAALWSLFERYGIAKCYVEAVNFQRLVGRDFRREAQERKKADPPKPWQLPIEDDQPQGAKEDRIAGLEPPISNGWLQFSQLVPQPVLNQFDDFPDAAHDDGPDAIAGAYRCSGGAPLALGQERLS